MASGFEAPIERARAVFKDAGVLRGHPRLLVGVVLPRLLPKKGAFKSRKGQDQKAVENLKLRKDSS